MMGYMLKERKGQATMFTIIFAFVSFVVFSAFYPSLKSAIDTFVPTADPTTAALVILIPASIVLSLIMTVIFQAFPSRQPQFT